MKFVWLYVAAVCIIAIGMFFRPECKDCTNEANDPWKVLRQPYNPGVYQPIRKQYDLRPDVPEDRYGRKTWIQ